MKAAAIMIDWEGSSEELSRILERARNGGGRAVVVRQGESRGEEGGADSEEESPWSPKILSEFWEHLKKRDHRRDQVRVLEALAKEGGKLPADELVRRTKFSSEKLRNVLSAITRNAKRFTDNEKIRVIDKGADGESYVLREPVLGFVRNRIA